MPMCIIQSVMNTRCVRATGTHVRLLASLHVANEAYTSGATSYKIALQAKAKTISDHRADHWFDGSRRTDHAGTHNAKIQHLCSSR
eukprot:scaffold53136_cov30-Prasinocladus_malaysianus.AAC.1